MVAIFPCFCIALPSESGWCHQTQQFGWELNGMNMLVKRKYPITSDHLLPIDANDWQPMMIHASQLLVSWQEIEPSFSYRRKGKKCYIHKTPHSCISIQIIHTNIKIFLQVIN